LARPEWAALELVQLHPHREQFQIVGSRIHQKLLVIDGLLMFKGSANLSHRAWQSAADDRDIIEAVTDHSEIIEFNNRYFSKRLAKEISIPQMTVLTDTELPFIFPASIPF
jgi:phosphatidylserine/phosphatidylglycerophosphate/cardiolipin synthase-like enzyme